MSETPTQVTFGTQAGHLASCLQSLLLEIGFKGRPIYQGYHQTVGEQEYWRVEVRIFANVGDTAAFHIFDAPQRRDTFLAGIQDAAREAIRRLREMYSPELKDSAFRYYPRRYPASSRSIYASTETEDDSRLKQQVELTQALDGAYEMAMDELSYLAYKLRRAEEELAMFRGAEDCASSVSGISVESAPKRRRTGIKKHYLAQFKPAQ